MKQCKTCLIDKCESDFYLSGRGKPRAHCKACLSLKVDKTKAKVYRTRYYDKNSSKVKRKSAEFRKLNQGYCRRYQEQNKERLAKARKEYDANLKSKHQFRWMAKVFNVHSTVKIAAIDLWRIAKRQKMRCALTSRKLTSGDISIDHIEPKSRGGKDCLTNLQLTTYKANQVKSSLTVEELKEICKDILTTVS